MYFLSSGMRIGLDNGEGDISFISHAHSDHLNGAAKREVVIASKETLELAALKANISVPPNVKLLDSGHILGSKQLFLEGDGATMVYTGDLRIRESILFNGAEVKECDKLIIDGTYADPSYKFPDYIELYDEIARWVKENINANIIIGCYELGKTQELIKILNDYVGIAPIINEKAERFCRIYERYNIKLDRLVIGSAEAEEEMKRGFVALVPMHQAKRYFARRLSEAFGRKTLCAVATGWALHYRYNVDKGFALSDHADFYDLKSYIEQSGAKGVVFHSGDGTALLKACGLPRWQKT
jgi:putative mRNA 3-end processing factor